MCGMVRPPGELLPSIIRNIRLACGWFGAIARRGWAARCAIRVGENSSKLLYNRAVLPPEDAKRSHHVAYPGQSPPAYVLPLPCRAGRAVRARFRHRGVRRRPAARRRPSARATSSWALGLRANPGFAVISIVAGAIILVCAMIGRNIDRYVNVVGGLFFMVVGMGMLLLMRTDANFLGFSMANCDRVVRDRHRAVRRRSLRQGPRRRRDARLAVVDTWQSGAVAGREPSATRVSGSKTCRVTRFRDLYRDATLSAAPGRPWCNWQHAGLWCPFSRFES